MKIIGVCGSPRKGGNTEILLKEALKGSEGKGAKTSLILISESEIELCEGCLCCEDTKACHIMDDMQEIYKKIINSDGIIFGSPVYWDNVTPQMKNFIDRMNPIADKLKGKRFGFILVGQCKGNEMKESHRIVIEWFKDLTKLYKGKFVGVVDVSARLPGEISNYKNSINAAMKLGRKIVGNSISG